MELNITLRQATESDTAFAKKAHHVAYREVVVRQFGSWDEGLQDEFFNKSWNVESHQIISVNGTSCGYYAMEYNPDHIFVSELVLLPEYQGKGIGSKLLNDLIEEAKRKKLPIRLQVLKENIVQRLYRRLGYRETDTTGTHIKFEFNSSRKE